MVVKKKLFYMIYEPNAWLTDEVLIKLKDSFLNTVSFFNFVFYSSMYLFLNELVQEINVIWYYII